VVKRNSIGVRVTNIIGLCCKSDSVTLASPGGTNRELGLAAGWRAQSLATVVAGNGSLRVREDGGDILAPLALHIQEVGVGVLYESLKFVHVFLLGGVHIQKVHFHCAL